MTSGSSYRENLRTQLAELQHERNNAVGKAAKRAIGMKMNEITRLLGQNGEQAMRFRNVFYHTAKRELDDETFARLMTMTWREIREIGLARRSSATTGEPSP
jgi:hypothetical protein